MVIEVFRPLYRFRILLIGLLMVVVLVRFPGGLSTMIEKLFLGLNKFYKDKTVMFKKRKMSSNMFEKD
jgi:hypothetical protein